MPALRRMTLADISAGMKGILTEFEKASRSVQKAIDNAVDKENAAIVDQNYDIARQKLLRKIHRLENGTNLTDVEQLKKDFRRLAAEYVLVADMKVAPDPKLFQMAKEVSENRRTL